MMAIQRTCSVRLIQRKMIHPTLQLTPELSKSEGPDGIASWLKDLVTAEQHKSDCEETTTSAPRKQKGLFLTALTGDDVTDLNENDRRGKNGIESSRRSEAGEAEPNVSIIQPRCMDGDNTHKINPKTITQPLTNAIAQTGTFKTG
jgi:hypothetical protein